MFDSRITAQKVEHIEHSEHIVIITLNHKAKINQSQIAKTIFRITVRLDLFRRLYKNWDTICRHIGVKQQKTIIKKRTTHHNADCAINANAKNNLNNVNNNNNKPSCR